MSYRDYAWYVEPFDSHTNLAVSMQLPEENFGQIVLPDGQMHNLWRCTSRQARTFWKDRKNMGLQLNIYNQEGNGEIRMCNFLFKKTKRGHLKTAG
jgi:hypothetical protein